MDQVMADPDLSRYVTRLMAEEIAPLLPRPDGIDLDHYQRTLVQRFADPAIADRLERLCRRGSSKVPLYVLPSLREALASGRPAELLTLAVAGFCRHLRGVDLQGRPFPLHDDRAEELRALAVAGGTDPRPLLGVRSVFGDLGDHPGFVEALTGALQQLDRDGVRATLAARLDVRPDGAHPVGAPPTGTAPGARVRTAPGRRRRTGTTTAGPDPTGRDLAGPDAAGPAVAAGDALLPA
jgi:fructuronate reductase/mannitol 2-dehydrogenase